MIRKAEDFEYIRALEILDESALWLRGKGIDQWPYPTPDWERDVIKSAAERGVLWFLRDESETRSIGVARLECEEEYLWTDQHPGAVYLHNFALASGYHGKGIGGRFLSDIERLMFSEGRNVLRLDCHCSNVKLQNWYGKRGYKYIGDYSYKDWTTALFEKTL